MSNPWLLLWLEAPLQAWGHDSRFGRRDSLDFPTKSGVLGLLCCARGAGGEEREWLGAWADLDMRVAAYARQAKDGTAAVREPLLTDFHMVGSGYNDDDPWQNLLIPKTADGKKAVGGGTKMTFRHYVQDMTYAVALEAPADLADAAVAALQAPTWDLYLGRKNCVPTDFIYRGMYGNVDEALTAASALAEGKNRALAFRVLQGECDGEVFSLNDVPIAFGSRKLYRDRRVTVQRLA